MPSPCQSMAWEGFGINSPASLPLLICDADHKTGASTQQQFGLAHKLQCLSQEIGKTLFKPDLLNFLGETK